MCGGHSWHAGPLLQRHVPMGGGWPADARFSTLAANRLLTALQARRLAAGLAIQDLDQDLLAALLSLCIHLDI